LDRHLWKDLSTLGHITDALLGAIVGRLLDYLYTIQFYGSMWSLNQAHNALEGSGFAHTVATDQADNLTLRYGQTQVLDDATFTITGIKMFNL
jgi:hypothetical protein